MRIDICRLPCDLEVRIFLYDELKINKGDCHDSKEVVFSQCIFISAAYGMLCRESGAGGLKYSFVLPDSYSTERKNTSSGYQYFTARHPQDTIVMTVTSASYSGKSFDSMSGSEIQKLEESMQAQVRAYGLHCRRMRLLYFKRDKVPEI